MQAYFRLQVRLLERHLRAWGITPWVAVVLVPLFFFGLGLLLLDRTDYAAYAIAFFCLLALTQLGGRERNFFLRIQFLRQTYWRIRLIENGLYLLPFVLLLLFKGFWALALVQTLVGIAMVFLTGDGLGNWVIPTPFSRYPFEFAIGIRKSWPLLLLAAFLLVMGVRVSNFELSLFAYFVVVFTAMGYYGKPEPGFFVWIHHFTPQAFLRRKLLLAIGNLLVLAIPFLLILMFSFPERYGIILVGLFLGVNYLILMVVAKYTAFPDDLAVTQA
ncbi:MAG: hypothetical protein AAGA31_21490, partial [Bacteroidota bacterium]